MPGLGCALERLAHLAGEIIGAIGLVDELAVQFLGRAARHMREAGGVEYLEVRLQALGAIREPRAGAGARKLTSRHGSAPFGPSATALALTHRDECRTLAGQRGEARWRGKRSSSRRAREWPR